MKLSCNSICVLERIRKSIPPFTWGITALAVPCLVTIPTTARHHGINWSPGLRYEVQAQIESEGKKDRHQSWSSDGGHAD